MKISARNKLAGRIVEVTRGATTAHVRIEIGPGQVITAAITNEAVDELGLKAGANAIAVIKASDVMIGVEQDCMTRLIAALALLVLAAPALAEEPHGCDKFEWSIEKPQQLLAGMERSNGAGVNDRDAGTAFSVRLSPLAEAKLKWPPERAPKDPPSFAGTVEFGPAKQAATYAVTLSAAAWIDLVQGGRYLKPVAYTGALDCPHARKSVKFAIGPEPFTLQLSGAPYPTIDLVVTPAN